MKKFRISVNTPYHSYESFDKEYHSKYDSKPRSLQEETQCDCFIAFCNRWTNNEMQYVAAWSHLRQASLPVNKNIARTYLDSRKMIFSTRFSFISSSKMKLIQICFARRIVFLILFLTLGAWLSLELWIWRRELVYNLKTKADFEICFYFSKSTTSQKNF